MNRIEALQRQLAMARERARFLRQDLDRSVVTIDRIEGSIRHAQSDTATLESRDATCSECGADVKTEALFSAHYVIPDFRYANLGYCPSRTR